MNARPDFSGGGGGDDDDFYRNAQALLNRIERRIFMFKLLMVSVCGMVLIELALAIWLHYALQRLV